MGKSKIRKEFDEIMDKSGTALMDLGPYDFAFAFFSEGYERGFFASNYPNDLRPWVEEKDLVTVEMASKIMGVHKNTIFNWIRAKKITSYKIGPSKKTLVKEGELVKMREQNT